MAEDPPGLPAGQPRLGIPEVWSVSAGRRDIQKGYRSAYRVWLLLLAPVSMAMIRE